MKPTIAVVVLNWQQPELTLGCIKSLTSISSPLFELSIILVDNGSKDNSQTLFTKNFGSNPQISLLFNPQNLGYVVGNNVGINLALSRNADFVVVLNNDTQVKPDFLHHLFSFSQAHHHRYILGPKIYFAPGYEYHHQYHKEDLGKVIWSLGGHIDWRNMYGSNILIDQVDHGQFTRPRLKLDFISGCCLFVPAPILRKTGLFDHRYFLYLEDADFCQRAKKLGFKLAVIPRSVIWHYNSGSSGASSNLHHYFISRNRLLFGFRWAPFLTKIHLLLQSIILYFKPPSTWHKQAIIDYYLGRLSQGSWVLKK